VDRLLDPLQTVCVKRRVSLRLWRKVTGVANLLKYTSRREGAIIKRKSGSHDSAWEVEEPESECVAASRYRQRLICAHKDCCVY
jgi:hypothetical protein